MINSNRKTVSFMWFLIGVMAIFTIAFISTSIKPDPQISELPKEADFTKWTVHIDAYSLASGRISEPINVWSKSSFVEACSIVYQLKHDDIVTMTQWGGHAVRINDASGREGWVPFYNIQELKLRSYN